MILLFLGVGGLVVMLLWNAILPSLIPGIGAITYFKSVGLLILSKILFSGFKGNRNFNHHNHEIFWKEKMNSMTDEERAKFQEEWKKRCCR
jgi:hypothetical protein